MTSESPSPSEEVAEQAVLVLRAYRDARLEFGLNRIQLGAHLHLIREHKLWKGLASSWDEFLASENINANAARQYISVARKFVYELDLDESTLRKLAMAGISALEKAGRVITEANQAQMIETLTALSERDAIQRIVEISSGAQPDRADKPTLRVLRMLRDYSELPPDLQMEFRQHLRRREEQRRSRADANASTPVSSDAPASEPSTAKPTSSSRVRMRMPGAARIQPHGG